MSHSIKKRCIFRRIKLTESDQSFPDGTVLHVTNFENDPTAVGNHRASRKARRMMKKGLKMRGDEWVQRLRIVRREGRAGPHSKFGVTRKIRTRCLMIPSAVHAQQQRGSEELESYYMKRLGIWRTLAVNSKILAREIVFLPRQAAMCVKMQENSRDNDSVSDITLEGFRRSIFRKPFSSCRQTSRTGPE